MKETSNIKEITTFLQQGKKIRQEHWGPGHFWTGKNGHVVDSRGLKQMFKVGELGCALCGITNKKLTKHHWVPKSLGGRKTSAICQRCHLFLHGLISNSKMKETFPSLERTQEHPVVKEYIKWRKELKGIKD
jgi:ribosomal protein L37E